jgi:hypothetical protein
MCVHTEPADVLRHLWDTDGSRFQPFADTLLRLYVQLEPANIMPFVAESRAFDVQKSMGLFRVARFSAGLAELQHMLVGKLSGAESVTAAKQLIELLLLQLRDGPLPVGLIPFRPTTFSPACFPLFSLLFLLNCRLLRAEFERISG